MNKCKFITASLSFLILFFGLSFQSQQAFAQNKVQQELLARAKQRPTALELMSTPGALDPIENSKATFDQGRQTAILKGLPKLVASIEKSYPGAIIGFLGRDTSLLANATEALYARYGYTDRVRFIDLSTPIFSKMTPQQMAQYLVQLGVSEKKGEAHPFVMVDYTSLNSGSQSTQLVAALTRHLLNRGLRAEDIIQRFNVVTLQNHQQALDMLSASPVEIQAFQRKQVDEIKQRQTITSILKLDGNHQNMAYSNEWHDKFDTVTVEPNGQIKPVPSQEYSENIRLNALSEQIALIRSVQADSYLARIEFDLQKYGARLEPSPTKKVQFEKDLKKSRKLLEAELAAERKAERLAIQDKKRQQHVIFDGVAKAYQRMMSKASASVPDSSEDISSALFAHWWGTFSTLEYQRMNADVLHEMTVAYLFRMYDSGLISRTDLKSHLVSILTQIQSRGRNIPVAVAKILKSRVELFSQISLEQIKDLPDLTTLLQWKDILNKSLAATWTQAPYELDHLNSALAQKRKQFEKALSEKNRLFAKANRDLKRQFFLGSREVKTKLAEFEATLPVHPTTGDASESSDFDYLSIARVNAPSERAQAYLKHFDASVSGLRSRDFQASREITILSLIRLFEARKFTIMDLLLCAEQKLRLVSSSVPLSLRPILKAHPQVAELLARFFINHYSVPSIDPKWMWPELGSRGMLEIQSPEALKRLKAEVHQFKVTYEQAQRQKRLAAEETQAKVKQVQYLQDKETSRAFQNLIDSLSPLDPNIEIVRTPRPGPANGGNGRLFSARGNEFLDLFLKGGGSLWGVSLRSPLAEITLSSLFNLYAQNKIDLTDLRELYRAVVVSGLTSSNYSNDVKNILVANSEALQKVFMGLFQEVQDGAELKALRDNYGLLAKDLKLSRLDQARLMLEIDRAQKRLQSSDRKIRTEQQQSLQNQKGEWFAIQKEYLDGIRDLKGNLPVLDADREVVTSPGRTKLTDGMQLSDNAQEFARLYQEAEVNLAARIPLHSRQDLLFTVSTSTLFSLYDQNKLTDADLTGLFEVVLYPKLASPYPDVEALQTLWQANQTSKAVQLLFGAPRVRKGFSQQLGANASFQVNKSPDGKLHVQFLSKLDRLRSIYKDFIKENQIAPSCRFIYR